MGHVVFGEGEAPGASLEEQPRATIRIEPDSDLTIERAGMRIGRYKLLEQIGEGGFGVVYIAEQIEPVQRQVALKVIKAGMDTKEVIARFEAERQALALMDHSNIARVLDAGATEAGRPYFVMELVRGIPITEFCDLKKLSPTERLELFMKVCQAVQHAHQKGIIHRDIKPSNVLVTLHDGTPAPKVIDFGIAKALGPKLTEKTLFTGFAHLLGTPTYMSPEQAELSGLDIDTRSDIYSLGVLLYELLTGVTPFDKEALAKAALDEVRRMIRETEPPKPSTRLRTLGEKLTEVAKRRHTEPPKLLHLVQGDLDCVVMKCLEKDRRRRYETANGLAMDLHRHLEQEPVVARPPSQSYKLRKFVRRNQRSVVAVSAVALVVFVAAIVSTWQWREAQTNNDRLEVALAKNELVARAVSLRGGTFTIDGIGTMAIGDYGDSTLREDLLNLPVWARDKLFERPTGSVRREITSAHFSPDQKWIAVGWLDGTVWICEVQTGRFGIAPIRHDVPVNAVRFSPDGKILATGSVDKMIRIWDVRTGRQVAGPLKDTNSVVGLRFSENGKYLVSLALSNTLSIWRTGAWQRESTEVLKITPPRIITRRAKG